MPLRRALLLAGLTALLVAGCGGDDVPVAEDEDPPEPTASASVDTSVEDALREAGVSDDLALRLGQVATRTGYGVSSSRPMTLEESRGFAVLQVDTCRDVAAGAKTWAQVVREDVAGGAPAAAAQEMNDFLRDVFCPVVQPDPRLTQAPSAAASAGATDDNGTRGVLSTAEWFAGRYRPIAYTSCAAKLGQPFGDAFAFRSGKDMTLCVSPGARWDGRATSVDVLFDTPVPEARAVAEALKLLPPDAAPVDRRIGSNGDRSSTRGSCASLEYSSSRLQQAVAAVNPDWSNADKAAAVLYSGVQTDVGASGPYDGTVGQASVGIGGHNTAYNSESVTC